MRRTVILGTAAALAAAGLGAPAAADAAGPATPQRLYATNGATSITLSWTEPATGTRPAYFQVSEGGAVVARNTTTHVTISSLVFDTTHTYTVTAVDRSGQQSAPSAAISRTAIVGGPFACGLTTPSALAATDLSASGVSVSWSNAEPYYDQPGTLVVLLDGVSVAQTNLDSARISGLAPASTHSIAVARRDCNGTLHTSAPISVTTLSGSATRPPAPTAPTVTGTTNGSVSLSWSASATAAGYALYDGGTRVATTSGTAATVTGLWRDTAHQFTVSALDAAGGESAQSGPASVSTQPCDTVTPVPGALAVTPRSPSTVALSWVSTVQSTGFVVYRSGVQVATVAGPSAVVTGLPSASAAQYSVAVQAVANGGACGTSAPSAPVTATTPPGPAARPAAPTGLAVKSSAPGGGQSGTVTLAWSQPAGADQVAGYRIYDGATVLATATTTGAALTLPAGPSHTVYVVSVDAAGNESALDGPVSFTVPFIPFP
ncbi:MAG TPA: fibronectin type III domain-containing protein [Actinocrinis sp.]|nr:fibronectin type III domain-containing protein [Actinocrinis sp.]